MILFDEVEEIAFRHDALDQANTVAHVVHVVVYADKNGDPEPCLERVGGDDLVLMQATNLKDKNRKEIYEGDIVRCFNSDDRKYQAVVEWKYAGFIFRWGGVNNYSGPLTETPPMLHTYVDAEVIGNIYENSSLIGR